MEGLNNLLPRRGGLTETLNERNGLKGVAMSAGRQWLKEIYVGFLLLLLSFLYLSHLNTEQKNANREDDLKRMRSDQAIAAVLMQLQATHLEKIL